MKKIILVGASLNSGNKGINALTRGQINLLLDKYGENIEIKILSYTVTEKINNIIEYNKKNINIEEIPATKKELVQAYIKCNTWGKNQILDLIESADIVLDISEGDSFSDIYGIKRFIQHSIIKLICIKIKKKLVIMPQTLGPFNRSFVKVIAKKILNKADYVFVRDELSKKFAEDELNIKREIVYIPDMAFYMKPNENVEISNFINNKEDNIVGINVSALLFNGGYTRKNMFDLRVDYKILIRSIIDEFMKLNNVKIILIPHVLTNYTEVEDDFRVCNIIKKELDEVYPGRIFTIDKHYKEDEIKSIISGCDFFIGSRMHACIGAISTKVPTVPIAYSRKFIGIWEKIGLGKCVADPRKESEDIIIKKVINTYKEKRSVKDKLENEIPNLVFKIKNILDIIEGEYNG